MKKKMMRYFEAGIFIMFIFMAALFCGPRTGFAEVKLKDSGDYTLTMTSYFRADAVMLKNNVTLDTNNSDNSNSYLGVDYGLDFDFKSNAEAGPEFYLRLERNGPYDYSAPLFIHNTLSTSTARVERYRDEDLLPQVEEFWADFPIASSAARVKSGLYAHEVGHGLGLGGAYENYGASLYGERGGFQWRFYYCRPDFVNKSYLGPRPDQDKQQGINYERAKANFFALDAVMPFKKDAALQPYIGILIDDTNAKRSSYFSAPTRKDILGTLGASWEAKLDRFSFGLEAARNFGKAKSGDESYKDVEHAGYAVYMDLKYDFAKFSPRSSLLYASGNKVPQDLAGNGDIVLTSGKNRAFSNYSPFNSTVADSYYPGFENMPMVAMGNGNGLNYGVPRPGTFSDPFLPENLLLSALGFDYNFSERLLFTFDWWHLRSAEKGVGMYDGGTKELSRDLGDEIDVCWSYAVNDNVLVDLSGGYFFPGKYYKEARDDAGSLFTPIVRGDGEANNAYQIELSTTISF